MSEKFALHYQLLLGYLAGIDALRLRGQADVGTIAQSGALAALALLEADLLATLADDGTEQEWCAVFERERRGELVRIWEANRGALGAAAMTPAALLGGGGA